MIEIEIETGVESPPSPETRSLDGARGVPVVLGDGKEWLLARGGLAPVLDGFRDKLDDQARLRGEVQMADVYDVASALLLDNYDLDLNELAALLAGADPDQLADRVMTALFGDPNPRRTWTNWARSALIANGLIPESIEPETLPFVLDQLVSTRRALPPGKWIDSAVAAPTLARYRAKAEAQAETRRRAAEADAAKVAEPGAPTPTEPTA